MYLYFIGGEQTDRRTYYLCTWWWSCMACASKLDLV